MKLNSLNGVYKVSKSSKRANKTALKLALRTQKEEETLSNLKLNRVKNPISRSTYKLQNMAKFKTEIIKEFKSINSTYSEIQLLKTKTKATFKLNVDNWQIHKIGTDSIKLKANTAYKLNTFHDLTARNNENIFL